MLMELVVAMVLMSICGCMFTAAVVTLSRSSNQTQAINDATAQTNRAFQTLDRTVRYAAAISTPGQATTGPKNWYVELRDTTGGSEVCTQLRVDVTTQQLQSRTWNVATPSAVTAWTPLASGITNGGGASGSDTQPFSLATQGATATRQQLGITLVGTSGPTGQKASSRSSFMLTALNSTSSTPPTDPVCAQVGRP